MGEEKDLFKEERDRLKGALERLSDAAVTLGEFVADNAFGDPMLRPAMNLANEAMGAASAAATLAHRAVQAMPPKNGRGVFVEAHWRSTEGEVAKQ